MRQELTGCALVEVEGEYVYSHEDEVLVLLEFLAVQKLAQDFIALICEDHHDSVRRSHIRFQDEICYFNFDLLWSHSLSLRSV